MPLLALAKECIVAKKEGPGIVLPTTDPARLVPET